MYLPEHFAENDSDGIVKLLEEFPLATLVCNSPNGLVANHIPMIVEAGVLIGHIAKANDLHREIADGSDVLAVFQAEDVYISPNYYPTKQTTHRHVPTWNYQVARVNGKIFFDHDVKAKMAVVGKMTTFFERKLFGSKGWRMADAPKDFLQDKLNEIVSFRIEITDIVGKSKVSQNKEQADFENVTKVMKQKGKSKLFEKMQSVLPKPS